MVDPPDRLPSQKLARVRGSLLPPDDGLAKRQRATGSVWGTLSES